MTKIAMFTGSFDPITNGHMDIIARAKIGRASCRERVSSPV